MIFGMMSTSSSKKHSDSGFGPCNSSNGIVRWAASQISLLGQRAIPKKCSGFSELCSRMLPIAPVRWVWIFRVPSSHVRTNSSMSSFLTVQRYITRIILIKILVDVYRSYAYSSLPNQGTQLMQRPPSAKLFWHGDSLSGCSRLLSGIGRHGKGRGPLPPPVLNSLRPISEVSVVSIGVTKEVGTSRTLDRGR